MARGKIVCFYGGKGGVGKTTTLLSLAGTLSKLNKILLEFEDVKKNIKSNIIAYNTDMINSIISLKNMEYSFDKTKSEMEEIFIKESNNYCSPSSLTHYKGQFNQEKDNVKKFSIITSKTRLIYMPTFIL